MYFFVFVFLFVIELLYFKIAERYKIIDKPNARSSHNKITIRGGGVIFYFGALIFFIFSGFQYPWFFLGLTLMSLVSFVDDIYSLSNKIRLLIHFVSVLLLAYELEMFSMPWYILLIAFIVVVGVINAYNFMDGINGITACYSLAVGLLLMMVNHSINFIDQNLLIFSLLGVLVFAYFNFRNMAKAFAGDVGSVAIAFILLFALGSLIIKTQNLIYILFLAVYGIDAIWTIIQRLLKKENIFEAHRSHLYQYFVNEAGANKLVISSVYGVFQFIIGILVIEFTHKSIEFQIYFSCILLAFLSVLYLVVKSFVSKKYVKCCNKAP